MKRQELQVAALQNGTVIDHIPSAKLFQVISLLHLEKERSAVTIGYNLKSGKMGSKGIIKIADKFQGTGTYSLKGYYPQWDVTLENITELGFGENMDYYAGKQATEVNNFVLWGNATIGAYVPFKGSTMLLNAGLGLDVPFMAVGKTNAGSKAVMPAFEIGMVYTLK